MISIQYYQGLGWVVLKREIHPSLTLRKFTNTMLNYKKNREKFRDSIVDNSAQWVVGSLIGAIITGVVAVLIAVVFGSRP